MSYWLFKTEPDEFSIDDLRLADGQVAGWEGVRNYQARNFLRDKVKLDDLVFIYHSSCKRLGIAGMAKVVKEAYPDPTQFDSASAYYDPKSTPQNPRWWMVDVAYVRAFSEVLSLDKIKSMEGISQLPLIKRGHRLSIMPVDDIEWQRLLAAAT